MTRPDNLKVGDMFRVIVRGSKFKLGEIIYLKKDDGSTKPCFWNTDRFDYYCIHFSKLEPYTKTVRYAQVGDVVIGNNTGFEYMVLERGQNTVLLSSADNFKRAQSDHHFDQLEEGYTLKDAPVGETIPTMSQIAEKPGVDVSKLKIKKE